MSFSEGDFVSGVNDTKFDDMSYAASVEAIKEAEWPITLHVLRLSEEPVLY
jgi:hypothetical protein